MTHVRVKGAATPCLIAQFPPKPQTREIAQDNVGKTEDGQDST